jgi:hypothetical protein
MSFDAQPRLVRFGSAKALTRSSTLGALPEMNNPAERWF